MVSRRLSRAQRPFAARQVELTGTLSKHKPAGKGPPEAFGKAKNKSSLFGIPSTPTEAEVHAAAISSGIAIIEREPGHSTLKVDRI